MGGDSDEIHVIIRGLRLLDDYRLGWGAGAGGWLPEGHCARKFFGCRANRKTDALRIGKATLAGKGPNDMIETRS